jgi:hypothetical protein
VCREDRPYTIGIENDGVLRSSSILKEVRHGDEVVPYVAGCVIAW